MPLSERLVVSTGDLEWTRDTATSTERKTLDDFTSLVRLAPKGACLFEVSEGVECLVLEGHLFHEGVEHDTGTYLRFPPGTLPSFRSESGCVLYLKVQPFSSDDLSPVIKHTHHAQWRPGQGRLEVMPLHEHQGRSTALVKWPAGERFSPHRHWGGEEILVLSGTFMDEHGDYPTGSWLRSPHLSQHHPFVEDETVILVKVGHLA